MAATRTVDPVGLRCLHNPGRMDSGAQVTKRQPASMKCRGTEWEFDSLVLSTIRTSTANSPPPWRSETLDGPGKFSYEVSSFFIHDQYETLYPHVGEKSRRQLEPTTTTFMSARVCHRFLRLKSLAWSMMMEAKLWSGDC